MAVRIDIVGCARCTRRHSKVSFKEFTNPVAKHDEDGNVVRVIYTHYGMCPKMGQPILMRMHDEDDAESFTAAAPTTM